LAAVESPLRAAWAQHVPLLQSVSLHVHPSNRCHYRSCEFRNCNNASTAEIAP